MRLAQSLAAPLQFHLNEVRERHQKELTHGRGQVRLPEAFERKVPSAVTDWRWQWVFPSYTMSVDPRTGWRGRHQFKQLGVRGGAEKVFRTIRGREPDKVELDQVATEFWQVWHEKFDKPRSPPPTGAGSPYYTLEELSPWQENAIRALEERGESE